LSNVVNSSKVKSVGRDSKRRTSFSFLLNFTPF